MSNARFDPTKLKHAGRSARGASITAEEIGLILGDDAPAAAPSLTVAGTSGDGPAIAGPGELTGPALTVVGEGASDLPSGEFDGAATGAGPRPLPAPLPLAQPELRRKRSYTLPVELHHRIHAYERRYLAERRQRLPRGVFLCDALARLPGDDADLEELLDAAEQRDSRLLVRPVNAAVPEELHLALTDLSYRRERRVSLNRLATELVHRYLTAVEQATVEPPTG
jgi:hypothetical protein